MFAAHSVKGNSDIEGTSCGSSFEQEVFEEMGGAKSDFVFVAATHTHPEPHGRTGSAWNFFCEDAKTRRMNRPGQHRPATDRGIEYG